MFSFLMSGSLNRIKLLLICILPIISNGQSKSVAEKLAERDYPSVFQAWNKADNLPNETEAQTIARHDLYFTSADGFGLRWNNQYEGLAIGFTPESIEKAKLYIGQLQKLNPNLIAIAEIRYRDSHSSYLPADSNWWMRDEQGTLIYGWEEGGYIRTEFRDSNYQNQIALQAAAAINSGVVDGVMLDWWDESEYQEERLNLLRKIRKQIGDTGLILLNSNQHEIPLSAPYANGLFMECWDSSDELVEKWQKYQSTLEWAEKNMREPRINCLETWMKQSRNELNRMRATTTLALTLSDGFCLFSDPNPLQTPDHLHNWYDFYNAELGKPVEKGKMRSDMAWERRFTNGTAVYNPLGNSAVSVKFDKKCKSVSTGIISKSHQLNSFDGDIFLWCKD
jgi:hypothetical protein